ncbi:MAG: hypothetical protein V1909_03720 [Candidatus Micrarchaeota archaeon]
MVKLTAIIPTHNEEKTIAASLVKTEKDILPILDEAKDRGFFWDTDILVLAQRRGLKIDEFPVRWKQGIMSRIDVPRDSANLFAKILKPRFLH